MTGPEVAFSAVEEAFDRGDHDEVLRLTESMLAERPGDDAAHEFRARSLLALGRAEEGERHASDAVRLDPDEVRYRELLAQALAARGAHRDAAAEYGRLARNDPRQPAWVVAEAAERLDAAQAREAVEAARRAVRLDPANAAAQLALAQGLARVGDARGALQAAGKAVELLPGDPAAREALADARWLADQDAAAFSDFRVLASELSGPARDRVVGKARALYRRRAGIGGRLVAGMPWLFELALRNGWVQVR
jgi:Flp pilus assembly protein TadD